MPECHVGCGFFGIYAGILDKTGKYWVEKSLVTKEVKNAFAQHLKDELEAKEHTKDVYACTFRDGKKLRITAELMGGNENE